MKTRRMLIWELPQWLLILTAYVLAVSQLPQGVNLFHALIAGVMALGVGQTASSLLEPVR